MKHTLLSLITAFSLSALCHAQNAAPPEIIKRGFDAYLKSGAVAAFGEWKIYADAGSEERRSKALAMFQQIETANGKLTGWEVIRVITISESVRRVYVTAKFEQRPLFLSFDCYKTKDWEIYMFGANTNVTELLPATILGGQ